MKESGQVRIGIDVGGTFTHAVAVDGASLMIVGKVKVPTTHRAPEGVARGIIDSLDNLLNESKIAPENVGFIAHSTTQATNALLEGDVAPVGIVGMGKGGSAWLARLGTNIAKIKLAPGRYLTTYFEFLDTTQTPTKEAIASAIKKLREAGAKAIAVSEAFAVDEPDNELTVVAIAQELAMPATCGSEVSKLYGLKVRTRTAVINAAMLPKMIETANMTEASVRAAGIKAPIMIMRSDGGVMDIEAMRRKPIQTMLSGPAAGVAAAMMYLNVSDAIFLEVGGTSTDISVIRNGKALVRGAQIGGFPLYMRTLDVRTVGVAGGSMFRVNDHAISEVGPRSAHIAGLGYVSFQEALMDPHFVKITPQAGDPSDYLAIADGATEQASLCLTPTCAANFLDLIPEDNCARGNRAPIDLGFAALAAFLKADARDLAEDALKQAFAKCLPTIKAFIRDYNLDTDSLMLVGGGGGAAALVPFFAGQLKARFALAENADVVSAIGVALALLRETIERHIMNPSEDDIIRIREEAFVAAQKMGADPSSIAVQVEVDARANLVRATAVGATQLSKEVKSARELSEDERRQAAAGSMRVAPDSLNLLARTEYFDVFASQTIDRKVFGLLPAHQLSLRTIDTRGVIRLQTKNGVVGVTRAAEAEKVILQIAEEHAHYGDAGKVIPDIMLIAGPRIIDLSGMADSSHVAAVARTELASLTADAPTIIIASLG